MDKETREFLTKQFETIDARFDKFDAKFEAIDTKFEKIDAKFDGMEQQIDAKAAENRRHFEVVAEGLRSDIQQIAEGHQVLLDRQNHMGNRILEHVDQIERESMIKFSYADLDHRMRTLVCVH